MFNSLRYTKTLEEAGPRNQAEAHVGVLADVMVSHFATTQDLKDWENRVAERFKEVEHEILALRMEMKDLEHRLIIKLSAITGAMISVAVTITTLMKLG